MPRKGDLIPEPWGAFLRELDRVAIKPVSFHCLGGFVITRYYGFDRETSDVDVLAVTPETEAADLLEAGGKGSPLHRKFRIYLDMVTVLDAFPEDYDNRLVEMFPRRLEKIRLYATEAHDLALMKLGRNIERDREDVKYLARTKFLTAEVLRERYAREMRPYLAASKKYDEILDLWTEMIEEELGHHR